MKKILNNLMRLQVRRQTYKNNAYGLLKEVLTDCTAKKKKALFITKNESNVFVSE